MMTINIHLVEDSDGRGYHTLKCDQTEIYSLLDAYRPDYGLGGGIYKAELADVAPNPNNEIFYYTFADPVATCKACIAKRISQISEETTTRIKRLRK